MTPEQRAALNQINELQDALAKAWITYWQQYSMGTWQFWLHLLMFVLPLLALYFLIDRRKALLLGFFGFNVHVWFTYIDAFGIRNVLWNYPFPLTPILPINLALDTSLILTC